MSETKINLLDLDRPAMRAFFAELGEKPFRADQVMKWIYHFGCDDFAEMTNVNKVLREKLSRVAEIRAPEISREQRSSDGTIKWALRVGDQEVETVYIPEADRATLCVITSYSIHYTKLYEALGLNDELAHSSIRFSIGRFTTEEEIDYAVQLIRDAIGRLREMSPVWDMYKDGVALSKVEWVHH